MLKYFILTYYLELATYPFNDFGTGRVQNR